MRSPVASAAIAEDWREKSKPIAPGGNYPAKEHCSQCGLCDTYYIAHVKDACAFLGDGMSRIETLEPTVHGRGRDLGNDEMRLGVVDEVFYAKRNRPVEGAQWTGIVTSIAIEMLKSGKVEGVVCVASDPDNAMHPRPILATTVEEILSSKGVKPALSPNLSVLAEVEARGLKRVLFIGVGCAVQALRWWRSTSAWRSCTSWGPTAPTTAAKDAVEIFGKTRLRIQPPSSTTSSCRTTRCTLSTRTGA